MSWACVGGYNLAAFRGQQPAPRPGARGDRDLDAHVPIEPIEDTHQPVDGEPVELDLADAREVGRRDAGSCFGIAHGQPLGVESLDDFGSEDGADLAQARIGRAEIGKDVAGAVHQLEIVALTGHPNISLSRLIRSRTRSISWRGVAIPLVDFF